jgi:DNA modification methylase
MPLTRIIIGDCRDVLKTLEPESVHCVVTSPPYWGLRDYGLPPSIWGGGPAHDHEWGDAIQANKRGHPGDKSTLVGTQTAEISKAAIEQGAFCQCGAWRGALGLEPSHLLYVEHMVEIFREVHRILHKDGTLWLNLGDSYAGSKRGAWAPGKTIGTVPPRQIGSLKPKDLVGIPWRVAFALQADGWYLRQDIIWSKPNALPESVTDRCTKAHEYIFLLSKSERYHYDADAIKERAGERRELGFLRGRTDIGSEDGVAWHAPSILKRQAARKAGNKTHKYVTGSEENRTKDGLLKAADKAYEMRNKRSVWTISSQSFQGAHFATFPPPLIQPCIKAGCPKGGIVLDPFGGSVTTGIVASSLGHDSILIELNPDYVKMAGERIKSAARLFNRVQYG